MAFDVIINPVMAVSKTAMGKVGNGRERKGKMGVRYRILARFLGREDLGR